MSRTSQKPSLPATVEAALRTGQCPPDELRRCLLEETPETRRLIRDGARRRGLTALESLAAEPVAIAGTH